MCSTAAHSAQTTADYSEFSLNRICAGGAIPRRHVRTAAESRPRQWTAISSRFQPSDAKRAGPATDGGYLSVAADAALRVTSKNWVPLSRCTFLLVEVMNEPCVLVAAAEFKLIPCNPKTPWLLEVS
jgi:hypothetical protein